jgi:hypothetical protein
MHIAYTHTQLVPGAWTSWTLTLDPGRAGHQGRLHLLPHRQRVPADVEHHPRDRVQRPDHPRHLHRRPGWPVSFVVGTLCVVWLHGCLAVSQAGRSCRVKIANERLLGLRVSSSQDSLHCLISVPSFLSCLRLSHPLSSRTSLEVTCDPTTTGTFIARGEVVPGTLTYVSADSHA